MKHIAILYLENQKLLYSVTKKGGSYYFEASFVHDDLPCFSVSLLNGSYTIAEPIEESLQWQAFEVVHELETTGKLLT